MSITTSPVSADSLPARTIARKRSFYRPELDVLRFFAFLSVFLFHFNRPAAFLVEHGVPSGIAWVGTSLVEEGVFGVDLFFVLSAYLITELLLREQEQCGTLDVKGFYFRRILRIWPLYFFYIGLALIPVFNPDHGFTWAQATAYLLLAGNWGVIAWGWPLHSIVVPLWTVSIEEQFYLVWPLLVRSLRRNRIGLAAIGMLILSSATRIAMVAIHGGMNSVWCNTFSRLDPIAAGILVALILHGRTPKIPFGIRCAMLIGGIIPLAFVANCWQIHQPERLLWIPTLLGFPVVAISCTVIMLAVLGVDLAFPRWLIYLGKISYGLYVYHALGNQLSNRIIPEHRGFVELALRPVSALAITIVLAIISYKFLETPFLKLKDRFAHIASRPI